MYNTKVNDIALVKAELTKGYCVLRSREEVECSGDASFAFLR